MDRVEKMVPRFVMRAVGAVALFLLSPSLVAAGGNDFIDTEWRIDLVSQAGAYGVWIIPAYANPRSDAFTTGWIGVNFANGRGTYGAQFSQVGVMARGDSLFWFVYAEPGVSCLRGITAIPDADGVVRGCNGFPNDLVGFYQVTGVSLWRSGGGQWLPSVATDSGGYDVAVIQTTSPQIYRASVVAEEGYDTATDPQVAMGYYFYHPRYSYIGIDWPSVSNGGTNILFTDSLPNHTSICPNLYGGAMNLLDDPRYWYAGIGGSVCAYAFP